MKGELEVAALYGRRVEHVVDQSSDLLGADLNDRRELALFARRRAGRQQAAAPTTAFSWLRTWCPKSASSSASSIPGLGDPLPAGASSIAFVSFSKPLISVQPVSRRLLRGNKHRIRQLNSVGDEMRQQT